MTKRYFLLVLGWWCCYFAAIAQAPPEAQLAEQYYLEQDYEQALLLYEKLFRQYPEETEYFLKAEGAYLALKQYPEGLDFAKRAARRMPDRILYSLYEGKILLAWGKPTDAQANWAKLIEEQLNTTQQHGEAGSFLYQERQYELAKQAYLKARKVYKSSDLFAADLANVYSSTGEYELATTELLETYFQSPGNLNLAKGQILRLLTPENIIPIERALLRSAQKHPNDIGLKELLQDVYLAAERYNDALAQARSLDLLMQENGNRLFQLAQVFQNNKQFDLSNRALDYIINEYKASPYYLQAYLEKAKNFEMKAFERKPLDTLSLREAVKNYDALFQRFGAREAFIEALYRKAKLNIFYLNDLPAALADLQSIDDLAIPIAARAEAQLLLGDIYLLEGNYNKAKIAYLNIEEGLKEGQAGAMAKFRSARLSYFKGDFEEAKARLEILKENTSNDIANDAIRLFLLIQDNTGLDSTTTALQAFASAQLIIYQKRLTQALPLLDSILYRFPNHPLTDDLFWEKANLYLQLSDLPNALFFLDQILSKHSQDIYADDALFLKAEIYHFNLKGTIQAGELYLKLLTDYPGSLFKVEARKRARQLRGDTGI